MGKASRLASMLIPFLLIVFTNIRNFQGSRVCKSPRKMWKDGNYTIVALFPIHLYNSATSRYELNLQAAVWAEAFMFAVEEINSNGTLLGNRTIGYQIYDTCNTASIAQESVLQVILGAGVPNSISQGNATQLSSKMHRCKCRANGNSMVVSVIGGASSKISSTVSNLLGVDWMPQISYSSTSIDLSNKRNHPSFLRTIPPDNFQAEFIVDLLQHYGWRYINVLASDDSYGRVGVDYLLPLLGTKGKCVAVLKVFSTRMSANDFDNTVRELRGEKAANVTVLWSGKTAARLVINAAMRVNVHGQTWIATEGWGGDETILTKDPRVAKGIFGALPLMKFYQPFEKHIVGNSITDLRAYKRFYNGTDCKDNSSCHKSSPKQHTFKNSSSILRIKVPNVIDAVYAVGHGLSKISSQEISYEKLLKMLRSLKFKGSAGMDVHFNANGDPNTAAYSLANTRLNEDGTLAFQIVGQWDSESREIRFTSNAAVHFAGEGNEVPISRCADECAPGYYALTETNKKCCWTCVSCPENTFKEKQGNEKCTPCDEATISNQNKTGCVRLSEVYMSVDSVQGIITATLSVIGASMSLIGAVVFLLFRDTPLVRSSNRELSILQLVISTLTFLFPLLYTIRPNLVICYSRPLVFGVLFSISNSIVFTKADRLLRIFKVKYRPKRKSVTLMLSNKFQLTIVVTMAGLSVVLCLMSLTYNQPKLLKIIDKQRYLLQLHCINTVFATNILVAYMGAISVTCIVYTIKAKDLPRQFREGRYIGLGMFVASLVWLFYLPISFSGELKGLTEFSFCLAVCISNATMLFVIYWSKTWRILLHPEENNKEAFRSQMAMVTGPISRTPNDPTVRVATVT